MVMMVVVLNRHWCFCVGGVKLISIDCWFNHSLRREWVKSEVLSEVFMVSVMMVSD